MVLILSGDIYYVFTGKESVTTSTNLHYIVYGNGASGKTHTIKWTGSGVLTMNYGATSSNSYTADSSTNVCGTLTSQKVGNSVIVKCATAANSFATTAAMKYHPNKADGNNLNTGGTDVTQSSNQLVTGKTIGTQTTSVTNGFLIEPTKADDVKCKANSNVLECLITFAAVPSQSNYIFVMNQGTIGGSTKYNVVHLYKQTAAAPFLLAWNAVATPKAAA